MKMDKHYKSEFLPARELVYLHSPALGYRSPHGFGLALSF